MSWLLEMVRRVYPPRTLAIVVSISLIVWFAGPLGSSEAMTPLFRGVYWAGLIIGSVPFAYSFRLAVTRRLPDLSLPMQALAIAAGFSVVYTPVVYFATFLAEQHELAKPVSVWTVWAGTFLAAACAYTVRALLIEQDRESMLRATPGLPAEPRLLQRVDASLRASLVSISVRDHYVDVQTRAGQTSLLMRLSDAMAETEGVDGAQVHRSHWVAWDAIEGVERQGGNLSLRMSHGDPIPVSRNHREKLEMRGLI